MTYRVSAKEERAVETENKAAAPRTLDLLRARQAWALMLCRFLVGPVVQFYWYWLPNYLVSARGMTLVAVGALTWLPYLAGDAGSLSGGWTADGLLKRGFCGAKSARYQHADRRRALSGKPCCGGGSVNRAGADGHFDCHVRPYISLGEYKKRCDWGYVSGVSGGSGVTGLDWNRWRTGWDFVSAADRICGGPLFLSYGPAFFLRRRCRWRARQPAWTGTEAAALGSAVTPK